MDLVARHEFDAPPDAVVAAMLAPDFYATVRLPDVSAPEVLERSEVGGRVTLRVGYRYLGSLDPLARTVLGTDELTWTQVVEFDLASSSGSLTIVPGIQSRAVSCAGTVSVEPNGSGAVRRVAAELHVRIPIIGGKAERAIGPGILARLELESEALSAFLAP